MNLLMGDYNTLEVLRETELSFILGSTDKEVFLHKKQMTRQLEIGEKIEVFLYYDNSKRVTATMNRPILDQDTPNFAEVVGVNPHLGVFLDVGLIKDLLLSRDNLPFVKKEWPKLGDKIFCFMSVSKNQLTAKAVPRYDIAKYLKPTEELEVGKTVKAFNVYKTEEGNVFTTEQGHYIFVYFKHMRKIYRLGQEVEIKIMIDKGDFKYNGTLIMQKELMMTEDAEYIKRYLEQNGRSMPYTDKSSAEDIQARFRMSKKSFKRALGLLFKEKLVALEPDQTVLLDVVKDVEEVEVVEVVENQE